MTNFLAHQAFVLLWNRGGKWMLCMIKSRYDKSLKQYSMGSPLFLTQPTQMWRESRLWWRKRRSGLSNCSSTAGIFEGEYFISALHSSQKPLFMILQDKPPPPLEAGSLVKILVNVDIERILTINEVDNTLAESIYFFFSCCNPRGGAKVLSKFNPYWQLLGLGGRRFWDSAANWAGVEGSTCEGMQAFFVSLDTLGIGMSLTHGGTNPGGT